MRGYYETNDGENAADSAPLDAILAFEDGTLDAAGTIDLFAHLVRTGLAYRLQGFYGRTAEALISEGIITADGRITVYGESLQAE